MPLKHGIAAQVCHCACLLLKYAIVLVSNSRMAWCEYATQVWHDDTMPLKHAIVPACHSSVTLLLSSMPLRHYATQAWHCYSSMPLCLFAAQVCHCACLLLKYAIVPIFHSRMAWCHYATQEWHCTIMPLKHGIATQEWHCASMPVKHGMVPLCSQNRNPWPRLVVLLMGPQQAQEVVVLCHTCDACGGCRQRSCTLSILTSFPQCTRQ